MIGHQAALIYSMVLAAAADGDITDGEFKAIGNLINTLPVFKGYDPEDIPKACNECAAMLDANDGIEGAMDLIRTNLPEKLRETAYLAACEVAAADRHLGQEELRVLEIMRHRLDVDRLHAAAIERGVRARLATP